MLAEDKKIFERLKDRIGDEIFPGDVHKQMFDNICRFYDEGVSGKCEDYLLSAMKGMERELSTVFLSVRNVSDSLKAAEDFISVIEDEAFNEKLAKAQADGDIALISELLKRKKQKN